MFKVMNELLVILEMQKELLVNKNNLIIELINENVEKENMISVLMQEQDGMY